MTAVTRVATAVSSLSGSWTSATAATLNSDNAAYATVTGATKNVTIGELALSGFDFDSQIPSGATIDQVELIVDWKVSTTSSVAVLGTAYEVSAAAGTYQENSAEPTTDTTNTYDVTALRSWTRANLLDGTFRMLLRARQGNSTTSVVYSYDYAAVRVNYTAAAPPNAPTVATPSHIGGTVLGARWTAPGSGPAPTGYKLTVATDSGFTSIVSGYNALDVGNVLFKLVTGLSPSTAYYYKVVAYNAIGDGTASGTQTTGTTTAGAFRDAVLSTTSLVAYFRLGDAAVGTLKDETGGGNGSYGTGTLVNQTGILATESGAKAVYFDDSLSHFGTVATRANLVLVYPFTIMALTKPDRANGSSGTYDRIVAKPNAMGANSAPYNDYGIGAYGNSSRFFFSFSTGGVESTLYADADIVQGTTYLTTATAASGSQKFYVNDTQQTATETKTVAIGTSGQPLRIGQRNDLDNKYKGSVQEIIIFNAALTQPEIAALYALTLLYATSAPLVATPTLVAAGALADVGGAAALVATPTLTAAGTVPLNALNGGPLYFGSAVLGAYGPQASGEAASGAALVASPTLIAAGTQAQTGAAALTASPTLLAAGLATQLGAAALTATPTLAAAGAVTQLGAAALVASPTLSAAGTVAAFGAAALTASPTIIAAGTTLVASSAALTATPTLVAAGLVTQLGAAALTSTPTIVAAGTVAAFGTAALVATPTLAAAGTAAYATTAALTATPSIVAAGLAGKASDAALVATPTLAAASLVTQFGVAALTATPTLLAAGTAGIQSGAALTATPTLVAASTAAYATTAALVATPTLAAASTVTQTSAASLTATPTLIAAGTMTQLGAAALVATPTLAATATVIAFGAAALTATPTLAAAATVVQAGAAALTATPTLSAAASVTALGAAALTATPTLVAAGEVTIPSVSGSAALDAAPVLSAAAVLAQFGAVALDASGTLTAAGYVIHLGSALLDASPNLLAAGLVRNADVPGSVNGYTVLVYGTAGDTAEVYAVGSGLVRVGSVDGGTG